MTVNRTFDTSLWGRSTQARGTDIETGGHSVLREFARRKDAFYLEDNGVATCQALCPTDLVLPILAAVVTDRVAPTAECTDIHIAAYLPVTAALTDLAFPGTSLAGAQRRDVTIIDERGHRRTVHAEIPQAVRAGTPILLALNTVTVVIATADQPRSTITVDSAPSAFSS
ncbi:hypothetical protein [Williamsia muralis]|uniref:hypothetical protein n=1 Tax=Williamsia marianensis TaxID=85044 RepID=UPI00382F4F21